MHFSYLFACVATVTAQVYQGFNYGSTYSDGSPVTEAGYEALFTAAKNLAGTSNSFTSARLFTSIQAPSVNSYSSAFQAAIKTNTPLLLGLWASAGQANIDNELVAIRAALDAYGPELADLVVGVSVGSEDLYRVSPIGVENNSGVGAGPAEITRYINQVKDALKGGPLGSKPVGHVDTWTVWVDSANAAVISASDFIGMDAYPYFQNTFSNGIENGASLFFSAYDQTVAAANGKPVYVTETGWPVSGPVENLAQPNLQNAKRYWDDVGCSRLFGKINTWWFTLQDAYPVDSSPSFGVVGRGSSATDVSTTGLFDLSCSGTDSGASSSSVPPIQPESAASQQASGSNGAQRQNAVEETAQDSSQGTSAQNEEEPLRDGQSKQPSSPEAEQKPAAGVTQPTSASESAPTTLITKTTTLGGASSTASACPFSLVPGKFEYPHLIIPVVKDEADSPHGTSYNGIISPTTSSIFNLDFPAALKGQTCSLVFLLPTQTQLTTSAYTLNGSGGLKVERLQEPATEQTTYSHQPGVDADIGGPAKVEPGSEYIINSGPCYYNDRKSYKVSSTGNLDLNYFQDHNPAPIGLYVTVC